MITVSINSLSVIYNKYDSSSKEPNSKQHIFLIMCEGIETFGNHRLQFEYERYKSIKTISFPEVGDEPLSSLSCSS